MAPVQLLLLLFPWLFFPSLQYVFLTEEQEKTPRAHTKSCRTFLEWGLWTVSLWFLRLPLHQPPRIWLGTLFALLMTQVTDGSQEPL